MVTVYVWRPHTHMVGHAALRVGEEYISFWPEQAAGAKKDFKVKRSQPGHLVRDLQDDIEAEGNRPPESVDLHGMDEAAMLDFIADLQGTTPRYQIVRNNCSHVVAKALQAGSGQRPSFVPSARAYSKWGGIVGRGVWTPEEVLRYAKEIRAA